MIWVLLDAFLSEEVSVRSAVALATLKVKNPYRVVGIVVALP